MDRAERQASELYPDEKVVLARGNTCLSCGSVKRESFIEGYHQAEKDLALTWQDIRRISEIGEGFMNSKDSDSLNEEEYYKEILKRFLENRKTG